MLSIKVYGPGCANCHKLEQVATQALAATGVEGKVENVKDLGEIVAAGVLKTPGLAIDGKLVSTGRIPTVDTVASWVREAAGVGAPS